MRNLKAIILLALLSFSCEINLDKNEKLDDSFFNTIEAIDVDSDLYNKLALLVDDSINTVTPITCVQFIFPIALFTIEEDGTTQTATIIYNSGDFSSYLGNLEDTQSISLSYPISSISNNGTEFIINNNEELKDSLDECLELIEDIIVADCQSLIESCIWKVGYTQGTQNTYLGGVFQDNLGATSFEFNNESYTGTWTALIIEHQLYLNINLIDSEAIDNYFNLNWKLEYLEGNSLQLTNNNQYIILDRYCNSNFDQCDNFNFTKCEIQDMPEFAEFIFNDYTFCINTILQIDPDNTNLNYFETYEDAENYDNQITSNEAYLNTTNNQNIYVRVENIDEENYYIIQITINVEDCN